MLSPSSEPWAAQTRLRRSSAGQSAFDLTPEHVKRILTKLVSIGSYLNHLITLADEARKSGKFIAKDQTLQEFFSTINAGASQLLFPGFTLGKKEDGTPVCTGDRESHNQLVKLFNEIMPDIARLFEENSPTETDNSARKLSRSKHKPIILADELDNTMGFLARIFNTAFHDAHQFSINVAIVNPDGSQGFGCFYLPLQKKLYYTYEDKAYVVNTNEFPMESRPITLDTTVPDKIRVVTSNSANNPDKTEGQREAARKKDTYIKELVEELTEKDCELLHGTGINRVAMLLEGKADLVRSPQGMCWWDVRAGFEICRAAGLAVAIREDDSMPKLTKNAPLPELFFGKPELLQELGLKIIYGKGSELGAMRHSYKPKSLAAVE
jgi:3'-phosphoadenosine 5'-phosphosulfate (PAPS) 3'-phosphatase